jgi:hypothetical protein
MQGGEATVAAPLMLPTHKIALNTRDTKNAFSLW